jgi:hypothetical protein
VLPSNLNAPSLSLIDSRFAETTPKTLQTHVNASEAMLNGGNLIKRGDKKKGKGKGNKERSIGFGNDAMIPWLKVPGERMFEFSTVETIPTANFLTNSAAVPTFASTYFTMSQLDNQSSYSAVFDQYRIDLIEVLIEPQISEVLTAATDVGSFISVVDIDDANVPTVYLELGGYTNSIQTKSTQSHYHCFKPSVAVAVYSGAFTSFAASTSLWLDCASNTVQHYGIKMACSTAAQIQTFALSAKIHVSWRCRH